MILYLARFLKPLPLTVTRSPAAGFLGEKVRGAGAAIAGAAVSASDYLRAQQLLYFGLVLQGFALHEVSEHCQGRL